jgi:hypothetical protein
LFVFCIHQRIVIGGSVINGIQLIPVRLQSQETAYIIPTNIDSKCAPRVVFAMLASTKPEDVNTNSGPITHVNKAACNSSYEPIVSWDCNLTGINCIPLITLPIGRHELSFRQQFSSGVIWPVLKWYNPGVVIDWLLVSVLLKLGTIISCCLKLI